MKELSIEQKAEAYDKALERAKNEYLTHESFNGFCKMLANIFPELKECEDECIRKEIIYHIQNCDDTIDEETEKRMIAWLEKQKEKPIWTADDRIMTFTLLRDIDQMTYISNEGKNERLEWLNSLEDRFNNIE